MPASGTKKQPTIPDYRQDRGESGAVLIEDDPYRYMPTVGDMDTYLFGEGRHEKSGDAWRMSCAMTIRWMAQTARPANRWLAPHSPCTPNAHAARSR